MKKIISKLMGGVLLFSLSMSLTSCEGALDDILGEWSRPTPGGNVTPGGGSSSPTPITNATPLTLEAITAGTIVVKNPQAGMQYSLNGGDKTAVTATAINVEVGDKVAFYGNGTSITNYNGSMIAGGTADIKVYGNIMSLVDETGFATNTTLTATDTFQRLFYGNAKLTDASGLLLPAMTLTEKCYQQMFDGCTALTTAPELKAETLANNCYNSMFYGCEVLTTAPKLPATTLDQYCYYYMFKDCKALTETPKLPATSASVTSCYEGMFKDCTSLTTAYVKAAYDGTNCNWMFNGCKNVNTCTLYTDGDWSGCTDISSWQTAAYPTE